MKRPLKIAILGEGMKKAGVGGDSPGAHVLETCGMEPTRPLGIPRSGTLLSPMLFETATKKLSWLLGILGGRTVAPDGAYRCSSPRAA